MRFVAYVLCVRYLCVFASHRDKSREKDLMLNCKHQIKIHGVHAIYVCIHDAKIMEDIHLNSQLYVYEYHEHLHIYIYIYSVRGK